VHDPYKRPGIFIASKQSHHYNVNHRHTKLKATKPCSLWYIIRVFRPTHPVCNDTMENVMFQGDSTNSLSSVVINTCRFYSIQKQSALQVTRRTRYDSTYRTTDLIAIPCPSEQEIKRDSEVL